MSKYDHERELEVEAVIGEALVFCEVRGFGYGTAHLVRAPAGQILTLRGISRYAQTATKQGLATPVVALCGARVRSAQRFAEVKHVWTGVLLSFGDGEGECGHCTRALQALRDRPAIDFDELFR